MAAGDTKRSCTKQAGPSPCCNALESGMVPPSGIGTVFTYRTSSGSQRCAACEIVPSKSKKHPGQPVFKYHPRSCGASGCTALAAMRQGQGPQQQAGQQGFLSLPSL